MGIDACNVCCDFVLNYIVGHINQQEIEESSAKNLIYLSCCVSLSFLKPERKQQKWKFWHQHPKTIKWPKQLEKQNLTAQQRWKLKFQHVLYLHKLDLDYPIKAWITVWQTLNLSNVIKNLLKPKWATEYEEVAHIKAECVIKLGSGVLVQFIWVPAGFRSVSKLPIEVAISWCNVNCSTVLWEYEAFYDEFRYWRHARLEWVGGYVAGNIWLIQVSQSMDMGFCQMHIGISCWCSK